MGNVTSSNVMNALINAMVNVTVDTMQKSGVWSTCDNTIDLTNCNITNSTFTQSCAITIQQTFYSDITARAQINQNIQQQLSQIATAISQNISFNPGSTDAQNVANAIVNVGTNIANNFGQTFAAHMQAANNLKCSGSTLGYDTFDQSAITSYMVSAMLTANVNDTAVTQISQAISQSATAEQQNALLSLMIIIVAIVIMVLGTGGKIITQLTSPQFFVPFIFLAGGIGYLVIAYTNGLPPFPCVSFYAPS